jgi:hypothetical protein
MRQRATAATGGRWESLDNGDRLVALHGGSAWSYVVDEPISNAANAEHIASWDPPMARAVADLLDDEAQRAERYQSHVVQDGAVNPWVMSIANAYLAGEVPGA